MGDDLEQAIAEITNIPIGRVGVCAQTLDGRQRIAINADDIYSGLPVKAACSKIARR